MYELDQCGNIVLMHDNGRILRKLYHQLNNEEDKRGKTN